MNLVSFILHFYGCASKKVSFFFPSQKKGEEENTFIGVLCAAVI